MVTEKMICQKIPTCFHYIFLPVKLIHRFVNILTLDLWIIVGEDILSKQGLGIIYAGNEKNKNFLTKLAFDNSYSEDYIGKTWLWRIFKKVKARGHVCSLMITKKSKTKCIGILSKRRKCFFVPRWVQWELDIPLAISNHSAKEDLRRMRKSRLEFEVTDKAKQFREFYYNMYLPFISQRHGDRAILMEYDNMMQKLEAGTCELLLIKKANKYIAGQLLVYEGNVPRLWSVGVNDANPSYLKNSVIAATIYFSARYLEEKGYKRLNFGLSRPFLKDGVLKYKKKWGPRIACSSKKGFQIKPLSKTVGIKGFFLNNPFIYAYKNRLNGALFIEERQLFSKDSFQKFYEDYYIEGMSKLCIHRFGKDDGRIRGVVPPEFSDRVEMRSAESIF